MHSQVEGKKWMNKNEMNSIVIKRDLRVPLQTETKTKLLRKALCRLTVQNGGVFSTCEIVS